MHYGDAYKEIEANCEKYGFSYLGLGGKSLKNLLLDSYYVTTAGKVFSEEVANLLCDNFYRAINYPQKLASKLMPQSAESIIDHIDSGMDTESVSVVMRISIRDILTSDKSWEANLELIDFSHRVLTSDDDLFGEADSNYHYMTAPREYALALMENFKDRPKLGDLEKIGRERGWQFQGFSDVRTALLLASQVSTGESDDYMYEVIDIEDIYTPKINYHLPETKSHSYSTIRGVGSLLHNLRGYLEYRAIPLYHTDSLPTNVNNLHLREGEEMLPINSVEEYWDESFIKTYYYDPLEGKEWNVAVGFHDKLSGVERIYAGVRCIGTTLEKEIAKRVRVRSAKF